MTKSYWRGESREVKREVSHIFAKVDGPYLLYCGLYVDVVDVVDSTLLHLTITHCWDL